MLQRAHAGREVARHERLHGRFGTRARLDHYLELLRRKPGGLQRSLALAQERDRGAWSDCFNELCNSLAARYGASDAARQMVDALMLACDYGPARNELAVRGALAAGGSTAPPSLSWSAAPSSQPRRRRGRSGSTPG